MGCYYNNIKQKKHSPNWHGISRVDKPIYLSIYLSAIPLCIPLASFCTFLPWGKSIVDCIVRCVCMAYPLIELSKKLCGICIRRDLIRRMLYNIVVRSTIITQFCMWQIVLNFRFSSALLVVVIGLVHYLKKPHAICFTLPSPPPPTERVPGTEGGRDYCIQHHSYWALP